MIGHRTIISPRYTASQVRGLQNRIDINIAIQRSNARRDARAKWDKCEFCKEPVDPKECVMANVALSLVLHERCCGARS